MVKSMTGFGRSRFVAERSTFTVEVRSLNSKSFDLDLRLPSSFLDKESTLRSQIADWFQRGKVTVHVMQENGEEKAVIAYNEDRFLEHYTILKKMANRVQAPYDDIFSMALQAARTDTASQAGSDPATIWLGLERHIMQALDACDNVRTCEGAVLQAKLEEYLKALDTHLHRTLAMDPIRKQKMEQSIRDRISARLASFEVDRTRVEQEILLYVERTAIDEECVRLGAHLNLFIQTLRGATSNGKKMQFITQEIVREINTIGAKANDIELQRCVIAMKEEAEKIKEQLNNVL